MRKMCILKSWYVTLPGGYLGLVIPTRLFTLLLMVPKPSSPLARARMRKVEPCWEPWQIAIFLALGGGGSGEKTYHAIALWLSSRLWTTTNSLSHQVEERRNTEKLAEASSHPLSDFCFCEKNRKRWHINIGELCGVKGEGGMNCCFSFTEHPL